MKTLSGVATLGARLRNFAAASLLRPGKWSLSRQLLYSSLLVTLLLMGFAGVWIDSFVKHQHAEEYRGILRDKMDLLKASSLDALISRDAPVLRSIAEELGQRNTQILALEVFDGADNLLAQWQSPNPPGNAQPEKTESEVRLKGEYFGMLRVIWNSAPYQAELRKHVHGVMGIMALMLLALVVSLILLTRQIVVRPLRIIHNALRTEAPPALHWSHTAYELRQLSDAVLDMQQLKQEIKRSEQRYRGLFDNISAGCVVLSRDGEDFRIEDINASFCRLPVLTIDTRCDNDFREILGKDGAGVLYDSLRKVAKNREHCHIEELPVLRDGHEYWLECQIFALDSGELVLMIRDVTDGKLSRDLRRAKEAAEQANELKSAFLASMSHEIRTPLNGVLSMVELLRGTRLNNKQRHWVDAIRGSGQHLLSTINDILDFSRIEAGRMRLEEIRFSLGEVIGNLFNATSQRAFGKGLELVLHQDPGLPDQLIGDPFRIQQILINLVGNAIKFTEHGEVEITLKKHDLPGDRVMLAIAVRDSGMGIAPEALQRVFQPFEQGLANRFLFSEGTGLGLTISKRLVDAMGGTIGVESRLGEGSTFHFEVPLGMVDTPRPQHWLAPPSWRNCPALVWMRHEAARSAIVRTLDAFGFATHAIACAAEAEVWNGAAAAPYSLVVLDDHLIGEAAANLLAGLGSGGEGARRLVLYVVNMFNRDKGELERIDSLPDTAYVMKPVHASSLFNSLQELFGYSGPARSEAAKLEDLSWEMLIERLGARERLAGARILLVEDNLVNQEVAVEALAMAGIEVQLAANGAEAVDQVCAGKTFDGVLMDLQMPVMDGFQATRIIRRQFSLDSLPIIAMTAGVLFKDRQLSLEAGMNDHVGKPVNLQNLMETLMKWVKPAHPQPLSAFAPGKDNTSPMERALAGDGVVDWEKVELPGIKIHKGLNRLGGNQKLYYKLLKSFAKAHDNTEVEILAALASRDSKTLRRLAHTLKGVALTLGAELLHKNATLIEKEAAAEQFDNLREDIDPLIVHLNEVLGSIHSLLKSIRAADRDEAPPESAGVPPGTGENTGLYGEILDLLERSDTRLQEICTANQTDIRAWFGDSGDYRRFMEEIEHYRFEDARETYLAHAASPALQTGQHSLQF